MSTEFRRLINSLIDELNKSPNLTDINTQTPLRLNKKQREVVKGVMPSSVFDFHQDLNGLTIEWTTTAEIPDVKGSVKILSLKDILKDWKGIVYFDFTDDTDRIKKFYPIDFFIDEACVGAFLNEIDNQDCSLYLYGFGDEPINLNLDINGYIQMMVASKGFLYWQYSIIEILEGQENPVSQRFKEWMPKLFPNFNWQEYVNTCNQLKIES